MRQKSVAAVFDIASGSVAGLAFRQEKESLPEIITSIRKQVSFPGGKNPLEPKKRLEETIVSVIDYLKKTQQSKIERVFCVFSSPWYASQSKIIKVRRDNSFEINAKLLEKLLDEESEIFSKEWKRKNATFFLEREWLKTVLNGYEIKNPLEKRCKKLELYAYFSLVNDATKKRIEKTISDKLSLSTNLISFHSFPFALLDVLKTVLNLKNGALFIDISGEITDLYVIRNEIIEEISSFPCGENSFVRQLANTSNFSHKETEGLFRQYQRKELDEKYSQKIQKSTKEICEKWGDYVKKLFKEITLDQYLPSKIYLFGNTAGLKEIKEQIVEKYDVSLSALGQPPEINYLLPDSFKHYFNFEKGFAGNKDIFLLILATYTCRLLKK